MRRPTIAFLHLGQTHDEFPDVVAELSRRGVGSRLVPLADADAVDWTCYRAVNVRECRGYHRVPNFLEMLERIGERTAPLDLTNPMAVIRGTYDKSDYLPLLERAGVRVVPTRWYPPGARLDLAGVFEETGWAEFVLKPAVSSKSWKTCRVSRNGRGVSVRLAGEAAARCHPSLAEGERFLRFVYRRQAIGVQPYLKQIETGGETSLVFLGGRFSHAVRKTPAPGGWLAHEFYGGRNACCAVADSEIAWAEAIQELLVNRYGRLQYARIDVLAVGGDPALLECELAVPRLFLREGGAAGRYAEVLCTELADR